MGRMGAEAVQVTKSSRSFRGISGRKGEGVCLATTSGSLSSFLCSVFPGRIHKNPGFGWGDVMCFFALSVIYLGRLRRLPSVSDESLILGEHL